MIGDIAGGILLALFVLYIVLPLALYLIFGVACLALEILGNLLWGILNAYHSTMRTAGRFYGILIRH